jgi:hypothetical protein
MSRGRNPGGSGSPRAREPIRTSQSAGQCLEAHFLDDSERHRCGRAGAAVGCAVGHPPHSLVRFDFHKRGHILRIRSGSGTRGALVAGDRLQSGSVTVRYRGISQRASDNLWTQRRRSRHGGEPLAQSLRRPRVIFSLDILPKRSARGRLADTLARYLSEKFGRVIVFPRVIHPVAGLLLKVSGVYFSVSILRRKPRGPRNGEWVVAIDPLDAPPHLTNPTGEEQRKYARDLKVISEELHGALATNPGITRLRWFFEGWDVKIPAVRTPAELPWSLDSPESRGAAAPFRSGSIPPRNERWGSSRIFRFVLRQPALIRIFGSIILVCRLLGIMVAVIGCLLLLRFVGDLAYGERMTDVWLSGTIGVTCAVLGIYAINALSPAYVVQRGPRVPASTAPIQPLD